MYIDKYNTLSMFNVKPKMAKYNNTNETDSLSKMIDLLRDAEYYINDLKHGLTLDDYAFTLTNELLLDYLRKIENLENNVNDKTLKYIYSNNRYKIDKMIRLVNQLNEKSYNYDKTYDQLIDMYYKVFNKLLSM